MGVHGLWNLLEPSGKAVPLETLQNKVLAVDVSIWLHQLVKGFQDSRGNPLPNAHLLGLFHRICKLLFFKIKPVFVFDGDVPLLKKQTVAARQRQRGRLQDDATEMRQKLAKNILKHAAVKEALGSEKADQQVSLNMPRVRQEPDIFELPPLKPLEPRDGTEVVYMSSSDEEEDESDSGEPNAHMHADLHSIDVKSEDFRALPADIRHDILMELKETRKQNSWGRMHEMPEDSGQFSNFQMNRLLKRRNFQVSLEEAEKEMGGRTLTLGELEEVLNENGVMTNTSLELGRRIASDATSRFVYIREAAKTLFSSASTKPPPKEAKDSAQRSDQSNCQPGPSKDVIEQIQDDKIISERDTFEDDWISDTECNIDVEGQAGSAHKDPNSRVDLARDFMFVASDLTQDQIDQILSKRNGSPQKKAKPQPDLSSIVKEFSAPGTSTYFATKMQPEDELDYIGIISDESESDSEETLCQEAVIAKPIKVVVQPDKEYNIEEDMFADIFFNIEHAVLRHQKQKAEASKVLPRCRDGMDVSCSEQHKELVKSLVKTSKLEDQIINPIGDLVETDKYKKMEPANVKNDEPKGVLFNNEEKEELNIFSAVSADNESGTTLSEGLSLGRVNETSKRAQPDAFPHLIKAIKEITPPNEGLDTKNEVYKVNIDLNDSKKVGSIENSLKSLSEYPSTIGTKSEISETKETDAAKTLSVMNETPSSTTEKKPNASSKSNPESENEFDDSDMEYGDRAERSENAVDDTSGGEKLAKSKEGSNATLEMPHPIASTSKISTVELQEMQASLENQHQSLLSEKGKADRMAASITTQMSTEAQELLRLFGLPYIVAPMEAEAQCAFLDAVSLTDGTISDDSDIWLFGGRKVYKNFFNQKKHVMQFTAGDIQHVLKLPRNQMILLALLTGSDYTSGLSGVGPVTALEILAAFPSGRVDDERYMARDLSYGLKKFREWFMNGRPVGPGTAKLRNKLKDLELSDGFPSLAVIEAYLKPTVDESEEKFTWGKPDLTRLQEYARVKFGWTKMKTDEILVPVINKLCERQTQMTLDRYLHVKLPSPDGKLSKRVHQAVHRLAAESTTSDTEDDPQPVVKRKKKDGSKNSTECNKPNANQKSKGVNVKEARKTTKEVAPDTSNEYIPQREKDKLNALQSKIKAIELFRLSKIEGKKLAKYKQPVRFEKAEAELSESDSD